MGLFGSKEQAEKDFREAKVKMNEKMADKLLDKVKHLFLEGESIEKKYVVKEDFCIITDKRVLFVDKSLISSRKCITSVLFSKINFVSLEQGGFMKLSKEVILGLSGRELKIDTWDSAIAIEIYKEILIRI